MIRTAKLNDYPVAPNPSGLPVSVFSPSKSLTGFPIDKPTTECWECKAPLGPGRHVGPYNFCSGCEASQRQAAREQAARDREENDDE